MCKGRRIYIKDGNIENIKKVFSYGGIKIMTIQLNKVYISVLEKIYKEVNKMENTEIDPNIPDVFIPGVGKLYAYNDKRILYMGKDTNGWHSMKDSASTYGIEKSEVKKQEILEGIVSRASNALDTNEHIEWWNGGKSQFWDYIFRLQAYINNLSEAEGYRYESNETSKLPKEWLKENEKITQSFAWANTKLLQELNLDKCITESKFYKKMSNFTHKKEEERNEVFKLALEALKPDIIVILNWDEYLTFIGKYVDKGSYYDEYTGESADNQLNIEQIKIEYYKLDSGQHVFWTYHPRGTVNRGGVELWVQAMFRYMKDKQVF